MSLLNGSEVDNKTYSKDTVVVRHVNNDHVHTKNFLTNLMILKIVAVIML